MLPQSKTVFGQYNSFAGIDKTNCKRLSLCPPPLIIAGHDNRVGGTGLIPVPTSHTTVRAVRHTAVP